MSSKQENPSVQLIRRKRKDNSLENENCGPEKPKGNEKGTILIKYILDKKLLEEKKVIKIFNEAFVQNNKDKCKMLIAGKKYEIRNRIYLKEFKMYGINDKDETLKIKTCHVCFMIVHI